jgi:large subunit ribosomal protein L24
MVARVKKGDTVVVLSGKDKGKRGSVITVAPDKDKVLVKDIAMVTRHVKARKQGEVAGIKKRESYIPLSRVMPICKACHKPCRINVTVSQETGKNVRLCNKCKEIF